MNIINIILQPKVEPWSKQKDKKARKLKRREIKEMKRKRKHVFDDNDLDDLAKDARLLKKLKKGKVWRAQESVRCSLDVVRFIVVENAMYYRWLILPR